MKKFFKGDKNFKVKTVDNRILVDYLKRSALVLSRVDKRGEYYLENIFTDENQFINSKGNTEFVVAFDDRGFWVTLEMTPSANLLKVADKKIELGTPIKPGFVNDWINDRFGIFRD